MCFEKKNVIGFFSVNLCVSIAFRLPTSDGSASKGKQQTSEPVHILKRSFARTVSVVSHFKKFQLSYPVLNFILMFSI